MIDRNERECQRRSAEGLKEEDEVDGAWYGSYDLISRPDLRPNIKH
jgi:hypothetical protein